MKPVILMKASTSLRIELCLVAAFLGLLILLPVVTVFAIAKTSVFSLSESIVDDLYQGAISPTDTYAWGNCTYWAALLRQKAGDPIPNSWGNAATWASRAQQAGYSVDHTPAVGSIMQIATVDHGLGHVAYVEAVNPLDGSWTISEMNVKGFDIVDTQTLAARQAQNYEFIHDKQ